MKATISTQSLVEFILLGPTNDQRQLQDSPILGDVWIAYAMRPGMPIDLLMTPDRNQPAGPVAVEISNLLRKAKKGPGKKIEAQVAYLQELVAAKLLFQEVLEVIVPMTPWWQGKKVRDGIQLYLGDPQMLAENIRKMINWSQTDDQEVKDKISKECAGFKTFDRFITLAGMILLASGKTPAEPGRGSQGIGNLMSGSEWPDQEFNKLWLLLEGIMKTPVQEKPHIFQVSLNRPAMPALELSVPSVKGDAAKNLFKVDCKKIAWAILDSGIDGKHEVFKDSEGNSRITKAFDFSNIRKIISLDNLDTKTAAFRNRRDELLEGREKWLSKEEATHNLRKLAEDADNDRPIYWDLVEKFIEIEPETKPASPHGTHVAGILGANKNPAKGFLFDGMCPDIRLYDFRVLAQSVPDTEFAIIAALQFIRYMNQRQSFMSIHGANLSLSVPHDVRNFACGRTPICIACERLVESGVVVVAAAGNHGYQSFETKNGLFEGYTAFSITDPGNADSVITVGATHRYKMHTYGVSFFSSRGPTGDGRMKPDLVAPGERIQSSLPDQDWGELDGTSMAAPHVSGAAAMLMARNTELIGEPRRIKRILCESATDLGRERSFQGYGMLDVLRAFQKI